MQDLDLVDGELSPDFYIRVKVLKRKLEELYEQTDLAIHDDVLRFSYLLRINYENCFDYLLYHVVIGSTPEKCTKFDFSGEDSIEVFVDRLHQHFCQREAVI